MRNKIYKTEEFDLTPESIDIISERIEDACVQFKSDKKSTIRYRFSVEESLQKWLAQVEPGESPKVTFEIGRRLLKPYFRILHKGKQLNPYFEEDKDNFGTSGKSMLVNLGLAPEYSYYEGSNILLFNVKRKDMNQVIVLLCVMLASLIVGVLGNLFVPANIISFLADDVIAPIESTFFRVLSSIAGPMVFLSVAWGVYGIGDVYTLGKVGKKLMVSFVAVVFMFTSIGALFYGFLGPQITSSSTETSQFSSIFNMILGVIPSNIFSPFVDGNTLQIIFIAFLIGLSMIFLGQRTSSVARAVEQINYIITFLMGFISKLVPFFVFIVLVRIIWSGSLTSIAKVWQFGLVYVCAVLTIYVLFILYTSIRNKKSPLFLLKSALPSYLIALTTASSAATFESNINIANNKFGIKKELSSFGVPFGMVLFKPSTALYYLLICFYFSSVYAVDVSISWIVTAVIITAICAIATPPIPGGASATYTILFLQLGIPAEALVLALAIDMVFDFITTSGDMYLLLFELLNISRKTKMNKSSYNE